MDDSVELTAREKLPAIVIATASLLAEANLANHGLIKALADLGCSCAVRTREVDLEAHGAFCRFKQKMQDLELS